MLGSSRKDHELHATAAYQRAEKQLQLAYSHDKCMGALQAVIAAAKSSAKARTHASTVGLREGKKRSKLLDAIDKQERKIDAHIRDMEKTCILHSPR